MATAAPVVPTVPQIEPTKREPSVAAPIVAPPVDEGAPSDDPAEVLEPSEPSDDTDDTPIPKPVFTAASAPMELEDLDGIDLEAGPDDELLALAQRDVSKSSTTLPRLALSLDPSPDDPEQDAEQEREDANSLLAPPRDPVPVPVPVPVPDPAPVPDANASKTPIVSADQNEASGVFVREPSGPRQTKAREPKIAVAPGVPAVSTTPPPRAQPAPPPGIPAWGWVVGAIVLSAVGFWWAQHTDSTQHAPDTAASASAAPVTAKAAATPSPAKAKAPAAAPDEPPAAKGPAVEAAAAETGGTTAADEPGDAAATGSATTGDTSADAPAAEPPPTPTAAAVAEPPKDPDAKRRYDEASKTFESNGDQAALMTMVVAGCELDDGAVARAAFRKLVGRTARSQAVRDCKTHGIDLRAAAEGATAGELLDKALAQFERGDFAGALDNGREANRKQRSNEALELMTRSACKLGKGRKARFYGKMLRPKAQAATRAACKKDGVDW